MKTHPLIRNTRAAGESAWVGRRFGREPKVEADIAFTARIEDGHAGFKGW